MALDEVTDRLHRIRPAPGRSWHPLRPGRRSGRRPLGRDQGPRRRPAQPRTWTSSAPRRPSQSTGCHGSGFARLLRGRSACGCSWNGPTPIPPQGPCALVGREKCGPNTRCRRRPWTSGKSSKWASRRSLAGSGANEVDVESGPGSRAFPGHDRCRPDRPRPACDVAAGVVESIGFDAERRGPLAAAGLMRLGPRRLLLACRRRGRLRTVRQISS